MAVTLDSLIDHVEKRAPSPEPLALLATASATVSEVNETTDALLSHFVDRSRRAGHSWAEIGEALGVSKQAVQKRWSGVRSNPRGYEHFTDRMMRVVSTHAEEAAKKLGHASIGTEHLLLGLWGEPKGLAAQALKSLGVGKAETWAAVEAVTARGDATPHSYTPRAWAVMENCVSVALEMGHNYVGTEHLLIALNDVGGLGGEALHNLGVKVDEVKVFVKKTLGTA